MITISSCLVLFFCIFSLLSLDIKVVLGVPPYCSSLKINSHNSESLNQETPVYLSFPILPALADHFSASPPKRRFSSKDADWEAAHRPHPSENLIVKDSDPEVSSSPVPEVPNSIPAPEVTNFFGKDKIWNVVDRWSSLVSISPK